MLKIYDLEDLLSEFKNQYSNKHILEYIYVDSFFKKKKKCSQHVTKKWFQNQIIYEMGTTI